MIASLAMYDQPWLRAANDRLWGAIAARLRDAGVADVPDRLTRHADLDDVWRSSRLLLGQTCGYPLMTELRESVQLVSTPRYRAEGCSGHEHRAAIIVHKDHPARSLAGLRGSHAGVNSLRSNSGMNLLRAAVAPYADGRSFFGRIVLTGAHARSFAGVVSGRIDVAAIDAVALAHLRSRYPQRADAVRVLAWSPASPGLPLISAAETSGETIAALRSALVGVATDPCMRSTLDALLIEDFETLAVEDYQPVLALEQAAATRSYPELA